MNNHFFIQILLGAIFINLSIQETSDLCQLQYYSIGYKAQCQILFYNCIIGYQLISCRQIYCKEQSCNSQGCNCVLWAAHYYDQYDCIKNCCLQQNNEFLTYYAVNKCKQKDDQAFGNVGKIWGIVLGSIGGAILIIVLLFIMFACCCRYCKNSLDQVKQDNDVNKNEIQMKDEKIISNNINFKNLENHSSNPLQKNNLDINQDLMQNHNPASIANIMNKI